MDALYRVSERHLQRRRRYRPKKDGRLSPYHVTALAAMAVLTLMAYPPRQARFAPDKVIPPTIDVRTGSRALLRDLADLGQRRSYASSGTVFPVGGFKPLGCGGSARCEEVVNATRRVWDSYERSAFGEDEIAAESGTGRETLVGGLGATLVDSLDTLYIMGGLEGRYERARDWVDKKMNMKDTGAVSVFETVIRILGGFVSIYQLSGDEMYMMKAEELGARLAPAYNTPRRYPCGHVSFRTGACTGAADSALLAEVALQLEFRALAHHSESMLLGAVRTLCENAVLDASETNSNIRGGRQDAPHDMLLPESVSMNSDTYASKKFSLGAPADSYFEYLVKTWVQGGRQETHYWNMFASLLDSVIELAAVKTDNGGVYVDELFLYGGNKTARVRRMQHLSCFFPGAVVLALDGLAPEEAARRARWVGFAEGMTATCYRMYRDSESGLAGDEIYLLPSGALESRGAYNVRPEVIEALFYMHRLTKSAKYREWGWAIFTAMEKNSQTDSGAYAPVAHPTKSYFQRTDENMPSFALAETLKYLFLLFADTDLLPADAWVFNTEAHPLLVTPALAPEPDALVRPHTHQ